MKNNFYKCQTIKNKNWKTISDFWIREDSPRLKTNAKIPKAKIHSSNKI